MDVGTRAIHVLVVVGIPVCAVLGAAGLISVENSLQPRRESDSNPSLSPTPTVECYQADLRRGDGILRNSLGTQASSYDGKRYRLNPKTGCSEVE